MGQLSFYSAVARLPRIDDLAGLLCANGRAVRFGSGDAARLSIVIDERSRALAMTVACAERGVEAEMDVSTEGHPLLRTAFRADLAELAARWLRGAVKVVPADLDMDGAMLRLWVMAAGGPIGAGYQLGLDPHAPQTHDPLAAALARSGLNATTLGTRSGGPALRIVGRRRIARLAELVGDPPDAADATQWPG
jgi:hypothetical protein